MLLLSGDIHPNPGPDKTLSVCHINTRSITSDGLVNSELCSKLDEIFHILVLERKFDIICISETWLDDSISDDDIRIPDYELFRRDRNHHGGGVMIYAHENLSPTRRPDLQHDDLENIWIECLLETKRVLVSTCYRSPNASAGEVVKFIEGLQDSVNKVIIEDPSVLLLLGDFNDKCTVWDSDHNDSELKNKLIDLLHLNNLFQLIKEPTRITSTTSTILDLIITDSPGYVTNFGVTAPLCNFDHSTIFCEMSLSYKTELPYKRRIWNYNEGDYQLMRSLFSQAPFEAGIELCDDIDDAVDYFNKTLDMVTSECIPNKDIMVRPRDKPWYHISVTLNGITHKPKKWLQIRDRSHKKFKRTRNQYHEEIFKSARRDAKAAINIAKGLHFDRMFQRLSDPSSSSKQYWSTLKTLYGQKVMPNIPPIKDGDHTYSTAQDKAEILNEYFSEQSCVVVPDNFSLPILAYKTDKRLNTINTCEEVVNKTLSQLDQSKANGPDGISNRVLKESSEALARPLSHLFTRSIREGTYPSQWKEAHVVPIHKKNDKSHKANYRPVSLLSCVGKAMEKIVFQELYKYCEENGLLTWRNSGFKPNDSTVNQLISIIHRIHNSIEQGHDVCMVFLDVSKAFDRVYHEGLIFKLQQIGIDGQLLAWFKHYLSNRKQRVVVNGQKSTWCNIIAGVPQGSILGPLLFLIYINDIIDTLVTNVFLFADDTSLMQEIHDPIISMQTLNDDLRRLAEWANQWLVNFNPTKTKYMLIGNKRSVPNTIHLQLHGTPLERVDKHTHLGLTLTSDLSWRPHIDVITKKAGGPITLLKRVSSKMDRATKCKIYKTLIRPKLEYACVVFDACSLELSSKLEGVQRQAAIACSRAYVGTSHRALLAELGWDTLAARRKYMKLLTFCKIHMQLVPNYLSELLPNTVGQQSLYPLRNRNNYALPRIRTTRYLKSFFPSTIRQWNNLSEEIKSLQSINSFKRAIRSQLLTVPNPLYDHDFSHGAIQQSRMRMGLSGLNQHRHKYGFISHSKCPSCGHRPEDAIHYLLQCPTYAAHRRTLLNGMNLLEANTNLMSRKDTVKLMLYGSSLLTHEVNKNIFTLVQDYIKSSTRFIM